MDLSHVNNKAILTKITKADLDYLKEKANDGNQEAQKIIKSLYAYYCIHKDEKSVPAMLEQFFKDETSS